VHMEGLSHDGTTRRTRLAEFSLSARVVNGASGIATRSGKTRKGLLCAHSSGATATRAPAGWFSGVVAQIVNLRFDFNEQEVRKFTTCATHCLDNQVSRLRITFRHRGDVAEWLKAAVC